MTTEIAFRLFPRPEIEDDFEAVDCIIPITQEQIESFRKAYIALADCGGVSMEIPTHSVSIVVAGPALEKNLDDAGFTEHCDKALRTRTPSPIVASDLDYDPIDPDDEVTFTLESFHVGNDGGVWIEADAEDGEVIAGEGFLGMTDDLAKVVGP